MTGERRREERRKQNIPVVVERRLGDRRLLDRRRSARVALDLWVEEEKGDELYFRRTSNLSAGGIFFEQTIPHALGTRVRLRFSLPTADMVEATGEIVNTPPSREGLGMGLRFLDLSAESRSKLEAFINTYLAERERSAAS